MTQSQECITLICTSSTMHKVARFCCCCCCSHLFVVLAIFLSKRRYCLQVQQCSSSNNISKTTTATATSMSRWTQEELSANLMSFHHMKCKLKVLWSRSRQASMGQLQQHCKWRKCHRCYLDEGTRLFVYFIATKSDWSAVSHE
jgi:hypothetical protein